MRFSWKWLITLLCAASCCAQQTTQELSPRDLFYREQPPDVQTQPDKTQAGSQPQTTPSTPPAQHHRPASKKPSTDKSPSQARGSSAPPAGVQLAAEKEPIPIPAGQVLGLRYNVVLIDSTSGKSEPADSDRVFQPGECIALEFEANSSGYLYVLEKGSSGTWSPLLPSPEMEGESNVLKARTVVRVPENHCFEITGPAGDERIFVALSRHPEDLHDLDQSIRKGASASEGETLLAQNTLTSEVSKLQAALHDRDLKVKKIEQPESSAEPANSVYVVNASATSSNRVVAEIRIQHR